MGWMERRARPAGGPRARHTGDRARRLRSVGTYRAGLLGDDGAAHGGIDRGVPAGRAASIPIPPRPIPISAGASPSPAATARRSSMATKRSGSVRSIPRWRCSWAPSPSLTTRPAATTRRRISRRGASPAPGLPGRAAAALRQPGQGRPRRGSARLPGRGAPRAATAVAGVGSRQRSLSDARADGPVRRRPAPGRTALAAADSLRAKAASDDAVLLQHRLLVPRYPAEDLGLGA